MNSVIIYTVVSLSSLGALSAVILYVVARKFKVYEDPRIDEVQEILPGANCGGCGFAGCRNFAEALVRADSFEGLNCPVGGASLMGDVAKLLGKTAVAADPLVAVVRCNGTPVYRPKTSIYDGAKTCIIAHSLYGGETGCSYGCLGYGDCVNACLFGAMYMDPVTELPVIIDDKCVACGACVKACPKVIIELRKKAKKDRKIFVSCVNCDKGGPARKACNVACIGCSKCFQVCEYDAITMANNLAFINSVKCVLCRKCVEVCPTNAIHEINFPPRKEKTDTAVSGNEKKE
ncbi:MAG: Fe-S cluster domain-containing protein [Bacteroidetes bacterium]|nr:Fe-S cluster domain-containing protein [Bacteroidota bacterium]